MPTKDTIRQAAYDKANCRRFQLKFNLRTDADVLAQLDKQKSVQGYIRDLIRADIAAQKSHKESEP